MGPCDRKALVIFQLLWPKHCALAPLSIQAQTSYVY